MVELQVAETEELPGFLGRAARWGWQTASSITLVPRHEAHCHTEQHRRAEEERHCHVCYARHADRQLALCLRDLPGLLFLGTQNGLGKQTAAEIAEHGSPSILTLAST